MQYYERLGLAQSAEPQVVDAAYKAMMRRYHPDVFAGSREFAESKAKSLNEAYQTLRDPAARAAYDRTISQPDRQGASPPPPPEQAKRTPEPWDWESDPFGLRNKVEHKRDWTDFKVVGGAIGFMFAIIGFESVFL